MPGEKEQGCMGNKNQSRGNMNNTGCNRNAWLNEKGGKKERDK
jgi:hypothetical protein